MICWAVQSMRKSTVPCMISVEHAVMAKFSIAPFLPLLSRLVVVVVVINPPFLHFLVVFK